MPEARKHLLLVEDEAPLRQALAERLAEHGFDVEQADTGEQAIEQLAEFAFDIVITDLRLPGLDGTRVLEAALAALSRHRRHHRHRLRNGEGCRRSDQARRDGLRDQAVSVRRAAPRAELRARAAAAEGGKRVPAIAASGALPIRRAHRPQPGDARAVSTAGNRLGLGEHDSGDRRDRHRQGSGRARDPSQQPAARAAVCRAQLRRHSRNAARGRALRSRARRVHRRHRHSAGAARAGEQGHAFPGRSRDDEPGRCR